MKLQIFLLSALLILVGAPAWTAESSSKTLLIADTGFSEIDSEIAAHTRFQLCIMDWYACPNGKNFQESGTAAMLTEQQMRFGGFDHGTKMARAAIAAYPDVQLILVRMIGQSSNGSRLSASESIVTSVLNWAEKNATLYNIGAVAISQGSSKQGTNARKCLSSPATEKVISRLRLKGIFSFFPVGNDGKNDAINWPSCIADAVAVGALDKSRGIAKYSNYAEGQVDLYEPGYVLDSSTASNRNDTGSSYSTQYAAARWLSLVNLLPTVRPSLIYWNFSFSGDLVSGAKGQTGWSTNVETVRTALSPAQR